MVFVNFVAISHYDEDQYPSISNLTQPALVHDFGWNTFPPYNFCFIAYEVIKLVLTYNHRCSLYLFLFLAFLSGVFLFPSAYVVGVFPCCN